MSVQRPATKPIQIGVVGVGSVATSFHLPILSNLDEVEIAFVADVSSQQAREYGRIYGAESVSTSDPTDLPRCDVALLSTPVGVRKQYIQEFGQRDVAVFSEKPFAPSYAQHKSFLEAINIASCNYMRTNYSAIEQLNTLLRTGLLGKLNSIEIRRSMIGATGISTDTYATNSNMAGGGILIERGCHDFSQLCYLFGGSSLSVEHTEVVWNGDFDVGVSITLHTTNNEHTVPIAYDFSMVKPLETRARYEFEEATVTFDHTDAESSLTVSSVADESIPLGSFSLEPATEYAQTTREAMYLRWKSFLAVLIQNKSIDTETETGLHVSRLVSDIYNNPDVEREVY